MRMIYKSGAWARKRAAKLEWHTVAEFQGGYRVRPMTQQEENAARMLLAIEKIEMNSLAREVSRLATNNTLYSLLKKRNS